MRPELAKRERQEVRCGGDQSGTTSGRRAGEGEVGWIFAVFSAWWWINYCSKGTNQELALGRWAPKKKDKKALLKKQEEERLRQEELARQEQERIRLLEEEERLRKEEAARIKAAWNDYLYRTKELDSLKLPMVNTFITEWMDDSSFEIESIVQTSHCCLQMVDEITSAIFKCPEVYAKTRLWNEGIINLKNAIGRKLDYASFMLLKDAYLYLDQKSQNMEYGFSEGQITLCLWANIYRSIRRRGMERNGFRFWIPPDLADEDCAVRILHLCFPPSLETLYLAKEDEEQAGEMPDEETLNDKNDISLENEEEKNVGGNTENEACEKGNLNTMEKKSDANVSSESADIPPAGEQETENVEESDEKDQYSIDVTGTTPSEPEKKFLNLNEYFLVGGLLHFDLLEVPKLTFRQNGLTYIHREEPKLRRMRYEPEPFYLIPTTSENLGSEKDVKIEKSLETHEEEPADTDSDSASVSGSEEGVQTPTENRKNIVGLHMPSEENAFSADDIALVDYDEEERILTFETNGFGIFGMFQKRYYNFPYKSWRIYGGKIIDLYLHGKFLSLRLEISEQGCRLESIKPGKIVASELLPSTDWMTPDQLIEKSKLEQDVYNSIALLSKDYDFSSSKWNSRLPSGGIAVNYLHVSERKKEKYDLVLIRSDRTVRLKQSEEMETFSSEPANSQKV
ncbi:dynein axonemal intermediate chain 7-like [Argiope bruennichi]|uniref:dynein axonemal intermediate chain 7-like n=1 Tax=Argiope bruennichi TaxID=94029 RepID=UPI00249564DA|nr:dynein axonemal intermediate chain 7-like [Argiope bruennichi]